MTFKILSDLILKKKNETKIWLVFINKWIEF